MFCRIYPKYLGFWKQKDEFRFNDGPTHKGHIRQKHVSYNYCIYPMFLDKQAWANSVDPGQMPGQWHLIWVYIVCHSSSKFLDATGCKMDVFKFLDKYCKKRLCLITLSK